MTQRLLTAVTLLVALAACAGGPGPDRVDWYSVIAEWVERGHAPDRVLAEKVDADGRSINTRPLCSYPQRAVYDGRGSTTDAASYSCRAALGR